MKGKASELRDRDGSLRTLPWLPCNLIWKDYKRQKREKERRERGNQITERRARQRLLDRSVWFRPHVGALPSCWSEPD